MKRTYRTETVDMDGRPVEQFVLPIRTGRRVRKTLTWPPPAAAPHPEEPPDALFPLEPS